MIDICDISGLTKFSTEINTGAKARYTMMKEDYIILPFSLDEPVYFKLGDYVDMSLYVDDGLGGKIAKIYELVDLYQPTYNISTGGYDYQLKLDAYYVKWKNKIFKYTPEHGGQEAAFSLTATLDVHLDLFLRNLTALGYKYRGTAFTYQIDQTVANAPHVINYQNTNMFDALTLMAEAWGTEWWVDGSVIFFGRCEFSDAVDLEIGVEAATMSRSDSKGTYATRIYAFGSTRNIPEDYREVDSSVVVNGVVQRRLMLPSGTPYIDAYPGMKTEEAVEAVVIFDDIYPHRVGTMSSVTAVPRTEEIEEEDGSTTQESYTVYRYKDTGLDFDSKYILPGEELQITFQTGSLSGMTFGVAFNPDNKNPEEQLWEIVRNEDYGVMLPNDTLKPKDGDTYILSGFDSTMVSDLMIPDAEQELKARAEAYIEKTKVDDGTYTATLASHWVNADLINRTFGIGQRVNLINPAFFENGRVSRILGFEFNLDKPQDSPVYTIGESTAYTRFGELEAKIDGLSFNGNSYVGVGGGSGSGGGASIYVIRTNDSTPPSDSNVFSALRSLSTFIRKDRPDSTKYLLSLLGGAITDNLQSQAFAAGPFGTGYLLKRDPLTGKSYMELDEIYVRLKAYFDTLEIKHLSHVGGRIVLSPASMECSRVEVVAAQYEQLYDVEGSALEDSTGDPLLAAIGGGEQAYRCYFKQDDGEKSIVNEFAVDDLVQCREFNVKEGTSHNVQNQYYWRRVINVGEDFIDLSITDCDTGSMEPKAGDTIVTIGNKTDVSRQNVVFLSSYDDDAPCMKFYSRINSYSMLNKEVTVISPNADKNVFTGQVVIKPGSTGYENLEGAPDKAEIEHGITEAKQEATNAINAAAGLQESVADFQGYVNGAFRDDIITDAEKLGIAKYINIIENEQLSAQSTYNELYNNPHLEGSAKVGLSNAWTSLSSAITALTNSINTAIADSNITDAEEQDVNTKYATFNNRCADFYKACEAANKSIQDKLEAYTSEVDKELDAVNNTVSTLTENINSLSGSMEDLQEYTDVSFADGIITAIEAASIEKYINVVNSQKASAEATYNQLYENENLPPATKTLLSNAKSELFSAIETLTNSIDTAISDNKATSAERTVVNLWFTIYNTKLEAFTEAVEAANDALRTFLKDFASTEADAKAQAALANFNKNTFAPFQASMLELGTDVNDLDDYVHNATSDGIITQIEAATIEKYINTVNQTKKAMDSTYTSLYNNAYLTNSSVKSALYSAKTSFNTATTNLINAINDAIEDGKTTTSEKNTVDSRFTTFNNAYATLATAIERANDSIRAGLKSEITTEYSKEIKNRVDAVPQSVKDDLAKKLGYADYEDMVYYAERGQVLIKGGKLNADIIETSILITSQIIANAIRTNTLNVNNKFKVYTDGSVDISGILHSLGSKTECIVSDGYMRIMYNGEDVARLSVNENSGMPEIGLYRNGKAAILTPESLTFSFGSNANFLTFDPEVIGQGVVKKANDGTLYIAPGLDITLMAITMRVSPSGGGTTNPAAGTRFVTVGESEWVEAFPAAGYEFDRWSDGGAQRHIVVWNEGTSLTAYFREIQVTQYKLTLNCSPSNGGTTSPSGTTYHDEGSSVRISATANSGYRFVRWSDGYTYDHSVTMNMNRTITAYFEKYTVTGDEIFSGTALTSSSYWDAYGGSSISSVSGGVATLRSGNANGIVAFNIGYLGSKIEQGHRYNLTFQIKASTSGIALIAGIGEIDTTRYSFSSMISDDDGIVYGDTLSTSYKTITLVFNAIRDSTSKYGLGFITSGSCTLYIRNISLKEV